MTEEFITKDEAVLIEEKVDAIGDALSGTPSYIALHVLCRVIADVGVRNKDTVTKREFVADCVECLDHWYEIWLEEDDDE
jgi:hypothetical protein